jgi:hypothetical protein
MAKNAHLLERKDVWNQTSEVRVSQASKTAARGGVVDLLTPEPPLVAKPPTMEELKNRKLLLGEQLRQVDVQLSQLKTASSSVDRERRKGLIEQKAAISRQLDVTKTAISKEHIDLNQKGAWIDYPTALRQILAEVSSLRGEVWQLRTDFAKHFPD